MHPPQPTVGRAGLTGGLLRLPGVLGADNEYRVERGYRVELGGGRVPADRDVRAGARYLPHVLPEDSRAVADRELGLGGIGRRGHAAA
jgi:hypothetical protein